MRPKELLGYSFPYLLVANTRQLEILVTALLKMLGFFVNQPLPWYSILACQKDFQAWFLPFNPSEFLLHDEGFCNYYNYGDDWAVFFIDITEKPNIYHRSCVI